MCHPIVCTMVEAHTQSSTIVHTIGTYYWVAQSIVCVPLPLYIYLYICICTYTHTHVCLYHCTYYCLRGTHIHVDYWVATVPIGTYYWVATIVCVPMYNGRPNSISTNGRGTHIHVDYWVATISRLLKIIGLFCRIFSLL